MLRGASFLYPERGFMLVFQIGDFFLDLAFPNVYIVRVKSAPDVFHDKKDYLGFVFPSTK